MDKELIILYQKSGFTKWQRIDRYLKSDSLPNGNDSDDSNFYSFELGFNDPYFIDPADNTFKKLDIRNGDNICITTDTSYTQILDDIKCGLVYSSSKSIEAYNPQSGEYVVNYDLNIKQRDFSKNVFRLDRTVFSDNGLTQNISTILDFILSSTNTRDDLGGYLPNGQFIPKYELLSPDEEVQVFDYEGSTINILSEFLINLDYRWSIRYFCYPDTENLIKVIQQVIIWQD